MNKTNPQHTFPLFSSSVSAGFPSPADDYIEHHLDLNKMLIAHPAATFFVRVSGESMTGAGIFSGDILIVDRAVHPVENSVIVAILNGSFTVKRYHKNSAGVFLTAENDLYEPIMVLPSDDFEIWGVVIHAIRTF